MRGLARRHQCARQDERAPYGKRTAVCKPVDASPCPAQNPRHAVYIPADRLPLVYALLPNYSTDRFWFVTFNANLSLTLFCAALYAEIRAVRSQALHRWRALSFAAFLV
jgi:hypothetical protein